MTIELSTIRSLIGIVSLSMIIHGWFFYPLFLLVACRFRRLRGAFPVRLGQKSSYNPQILGNLHPGAGSGGEVAAEARCVGANAAAPVSLAVIIPLVDEVDCLKACLEALDLQTPRPDQVVVVTDSKLHPAGLGEALECTSLNVCSILVGERRGKTAAQNLAMSHIVTDIAVFTDVSSRMQFGALEHLVTALADPRIGAASGKLVYDSDGSESQYWRLETWLRSRESTIRGCLGASGALYAIRTCDYIELDPFVIADLVEPLLIDLRFGRQTVYVHEARVCEAPPLSENSLLAIKARIHLRVLASSSWWLPVLDPVRNPALAFMFFSHKIIRWFLWLWLVMLMCAVPPSWSIIFLGTAILLSLAPARGSFASLPGRAVRYIILLVMAQVVGTWRFLLGRPAAAWTPSFSSPKGSE